MNPLLGLDGANVFGHGSPPPEPDPLEVNAWVDPSGAVAHPDAPRGGGGSGSFREGGPADASELSPVDPPHPDSPSGRHHVLSETDEAVVQQADEDGKQKVVQLKKTTPNPPPRVTAESQFAVKVTKPENLKVTVTTVGKILPDKIKTDLPVHARTRLTAENVGYDWPTFKVDPTDKSLLGEQVKAFELSGSFDIQTFYESEEAPGRTSDYGRGTTDDDEKNGDTTLGFHESCHRADFKKWLTTQDIPMLYVQTGDTIESFKQAKTTFLDDLKNYTKTQAQLDTEEKTDDVGDPTKDEFMRKQGN